MTQSLTFVVCVCLLGDINELNIALFLWPHFLQLPALLLCWADIILSILRFEGKHSDFLFGHLSMFCSSIRYSWYTDPYLLYQILSSLGIQRRWKYELIGFRRSFNNLQDLTFLFTYVRSSLKLSLSNLPDQLMLFNPGFLNLSTINIWGQITVCCSAVLSMIGC